MKTTLQSEASECALASLAMISTAHGLPLTWLSCAAGSPCRSKEKWSRKSEQRYKWKLRAKSPAYDGWNRSF